MKFKNNYLFADSQIKMRYSADQREFVLNNKELLIGAVQVFNQAMTMLLDEKSRYSARYRDKNWGATTLNGFAIGLLRDRFPDRMKYERGCWSYYGNKAVVKIKKLDNKYLPGNVKTDKAHLERSQLALIDEPGWPIIYVGYTVNDSMTEITGCYAVCLDSWENLRWITDLSDVVSQQESSILLPPKIISNSDLKAQPLVRAKAGTQRKANE